MNTSWTSNARQPSCSLSPANDTTRGRFVHAARAPQHTGAAYANAGTSYAASSAQDAFVPPSAPQKTNTADATCQPQTPSARKPTPARNALPLRQRVSLWLHMAGLYVGGSHTLKTATSLAHSVAAAAQTFLAALKALVDYVSEAVLGQIHAGYALASATGKQAKDGAASFVRNLRQATTAWLDGVTEASRSNAEATEHASASTAHRGAAQRAAAWLRTSTQSAATWLRARLQPGA